MKYLSGTRKASLAMGDDVTLTRFVKIEDTANPKARKHQPRLEGIGQPAYVTQGRTKYTSRVLQPSSMTNLLVSGHSNIKVGRDVRKGKLNGYWIYTLSLEERKTCPSSCLQWQTCYGSNMPFAKRIDHTSFDFLARLEDEITRLCRIKYGVLIRLHALGDFYSEAYVIFWNLMLLRHPNLFLFGYTARQPGTEIGEAIDFLLNTNPRSMIRFSGEAGPMGAIVIGSEEGKPAGAFICPEQTGRTKACATCGACWSTDKTVAFLEH